MEIAVDGGVIGLAGRQVHGEGMGGGAAPEDVAAGLEGGDGDLGMIRVGRHDDDDPGGGQAEGRAVHLEDGGTGADDGVTEHPYPPAPFHHASLGVRRTPALRAHGPLYSDGAHGRGSKSVVSRVMQDR